MTVHLIQRREAYASARDKALPGDRLILLGDGVGAVLDNVGDCCAVEADLIERGLSNHVPACVELLDDAAVVRLCALDAPIVTWVHP